MNHESQHNFFLILTKNGNRLGQIYTQKGPCLPRIFFWTNVYSSWGNILGDYSVLSLLLHKIKFLNSLCFPDLIWFFLEMRIGSITNRRFLITQFFTFSFTSIRTSCNSGEMAMDLHSALNNIPKSLSIIPSRQDKPFSSSSRLHF